jgi:putative tricarboxylic transport membrane protein
MEAIVAGVIISVTIYVVFNLILGLSLAKGPFGF